MNTLVVLEAFIDSMRVKSTELKDQFFFKAFATFCVYSRCRCNARDCHVVGRVVWEVELACNWFRITEQKTQLANLIQDL